MKRHFRFAALLRIATFVAVPALFCSSALGQVITTYSVCQPDCYPEEITRGPDGNLWFTEGTGSIGRITTTGVVATIPLPAGLFPSGITTGPDGNLWFTAGAGQTVIGRMTLTGSLTQFPVPAVPAVGSYPWEITVGPDGALWFTENNPSKIGRITTDGAITEFPTPTQDSGPLFITTGPDHNLWFTEIFANKIGRITPAGAISEFGVPTPNSDPLGIAAGPSGDLWFTESQAARIARISTTGVITEYGPDPNVHSLGEILVGPGGDLWFGGTFGSSFQFGLGRATAEGAFTSYWPTGGHEPYYGYSPAGLAIGPDGNLWFTGDGVNPDSDVVGKLSLPTAGSSIPALDWRGLAALAALLAGVAFFALRRA